MFLLAITESEIASRLRSPAIKELKFGKYVFTIVTDNFISRFITEPNRFLIIESPLLLNHNFRDLILSQVIYKYNNVLEIFRSTSSGRPIYYHIDSKGSFFVSTHISLLREAGVKIEENITLLPEFFIYRFIMPPQTMYKNIYQLPAGSRLHIKLLNGKYIIAKIDKFDPPILDKGFNLIDNIAIQTSRLISQSIYSLNPFEDRLAILLSGGLDSSILFKICQSFFKIDETYSTGYPFENPRKNKEKEYALSAAQEFQIKHKYYEVTNEQYLRGFIEGISAAEEPLHHLQSVMFYLLFKRGLPKKKDIVICGQGAGTIWGLNLHNTLYRSSKKLFNFLLKYPIVELLKLASQITGRGKNFINDALRYKIKKNCPLKNPDNVIWSLGNYGSEEWAYEYYKAKRYDIIKNRYDAIKPFQRRSIYDVISLLDFLGDMSITQLIWAKLAESQKKIMFYPLTHIDLVNYAYSIPWKLKLEKPKNILRWVARQNDIPEYIITRPKSGFGIRTKGWAKRDGIFDFIVPLASKVFDESQIRNMQSPNPKKAATFWNILNYSIWKRLCILNEPVDVLLEELNV